MAPQKNLKGLMAQTARKREQRVGELHLDLPVPTWDGNLVMRFNVVEREMIEGLTSERRTVDNDVDIITQNLEALYFYEPSGEYEGERMKENDKYLKLTDDNGLPVKFDIRLLEAFRDEENMDPLMAEIMSNPEGPTVRGILLWAYKGNTTGLGETAGRLLTWSGNTDRKVSDDIVPE